MLEIEDTEPSAPVQGSPSKRTIPKFGGANPGYKDRDEYGLLPRQRVFCDELLLCHNGTRAAILAGYSVKNASSMAVDLLKVSNVARYLAMREQERQDDVKRRQEALLEELDILTKSDLDNYRRQGSWVGVREGVDKRATRALSKIKIKSRTYVQQDGTEVTEHELDLATHSKTASVDMYMKHLGMFPQTGSKLSIEDTEGNTLVIEEVVE